MTRLKDDLSGALKSVGKEWRRAKADSGRKQRVGRTRLSYMRMRSTRVTIKDAAIEAIPEAYNAVSSNGRYWANARQIYYKARPKILEMTGRGHLSSQYFTQKLLKDYVEQHGGLARLVYDDRGHISEPYTGKVVGLGGAAVSTYISQFTNGTAINAMTLPELRLRTVGPNLRYHGVLFIEKEGFDEILRESGLLKRFDLALASSKGMPVSALCDALGSLHGRGCTIYALHDFDKSGFTMMKTLRRGTRGSRGGVECQDLGLRLADVEGLETEAVECSRKDEPELTRCGATPEEIAFLSEGQRVELNAMETEKFIEFVERKLIEAGATKLVPGEDVLQAAFRRARMRRRILDVIEEAKGQEGEPEPLPDDLQSRVQSLVAEQPELSWDEAVWEIAEDQEDAAAAVG